MDDNRIREIIREAINEIQVDRFTPYSKEEAERNREALHTSSNPSYEEFMRWKNKRRAEGIPSIELSYANYLKEKQKNF